MPSTGIPLPWPLDFPCVRSILRSMGLYSVGLLWIVMVLLFPVRLLIALLGNARLLSPLRLGGCLFRGLMCSCSSSCIFQVGVLIWKITRKKILPQALLRWSPGLGRLAIFLLLHLVLGRSVISRLVSTRMTSPPLPTVFPSVMPPQTSLRI